MTPEQFCYWLQGFYEVAHRYGDGVSGEHTILIRQHLATVFNVDSQAKKEEIEKLQADKDNYIPDRTYWNPILKRFESPQPVNIFNNPFDIYYTGPPYSC